MASPHVTGAIALMLQKKATLTPEEAKQLLFSNARKTSFTPAVPTYTGADLPAAPTYTGADLPAVPNYDWGYGVLDVAKAAAAIATTTATVVTAFKINEPDLSKVCASGLIPVLRAYNNGFTRGIDSNHRFTTSQAEYQKMIAQNWSGEGVVFCSPQ